MAVQAQYPSNVLLLNRNGQEGAHDYSLQTQPEGGRGGGGFLDHQSHMLFHPHNGVGSNGNNPRKRGRELAVSGGGEGEGITGPAAATTISPFSVMHGTQYHHQRQQQQQSLQLIDLSQLHSRSQNQPHHHHQHHHLQNQSNNAVSTGLRLSFGDQQHQLQQNHHHFQQQQQQQQSFTCQSSSYSSAFVSLLSEDFAAQVKRHRDELDQFLQAQGEQLRRTLAEKRQRHYRTLLGAAEESIAQRLREKEAEVEKATRRNAELEARAAQLTVEAQVWQAKARAQEATAATLQAQLQQAIMNGGGGNGGCATAAQDSRRGDDGMGGGGVEGQAEDAESAYIDPDRVTAVAGGPSCKACRKRAASVVLLPCRHLSVCTECDQAVQACPRCLQPRNSSVEVFLY